MHAGRGAVRVRVTVRVTVIRGGSPPPSCFQQSALLLPTGFLGKAWGTTLGPGTDSPDDCSRNLKKETRGKKENRGRKPVSPPPEARKSRREKDK